MPSALSLDGGASGQWQNILWSSVLSEWAWRSDFAVIYCSTMLGHGMQQDGWLWPQFWKCSGGFHLASGKAASCRSQYWFFRLPPSFPAEGPIMATPEATGNVIGGWTAENFLAVAAGLALWAKDSRNESVGSTVRARPTVTGPSMATSRSLQLLEPQFSHL